ncbi:MAG: response regulator [Lachnospiraceae bacterium]
MKSILIVEDEKMIRFGIKTMVMRSSIAPIETIFDCKNGEEALKILRENKIDVMITDIRMPKMNGIQLVQSMQELEHKPKTIVISGYDDFNYAVEMMRCGIRDYLLKPIEREKLDALLCKLEEELERESEEEQISNRIGTQQLKYMIMNQRISEEEIELINQQYGGLLSIPYIVVCTNYADDPEKIKGWMMTLPDVEGQDYVLYMSMSQEDLVTGTIDSFVGISREHRSIHELKQACEEAYTARKEAFVRKLPTCMYTSEQVAYEEIPPNFAEQFVHMIGNTHIEDGFRQFDVLCRKAYKGLFDPDMFLQMLRQVVDGVVATYHKVISLQRDAFQQLYAVLEFDNMDVYYQEFRQWMFDMNDMIRIEFDDCKNKEKMNEALRYIHENYGKDLNMAVVSNHISMNYSLFSLTFKQYTGVNFVNYLKELRMKEAKRLLQDTEEKVIHISHMVGYDNEKHFMKTFKTMCGVSPTEYRKNIRISEKQV